MCLFADLIIVKLQWFLIQFSLVSYLQHLHCIIVTTRNKVTNKREKKKEKINGFDRSVWWSEEPSFRANHRDIMNRNT